jgi:hypothetical protein
MQEQVEENSRVFAVFRLRKVYEAMEAYERKNHHLPAPAIYGKNGAPLLSWRVTLLPYLGEEQLYAKFKLDEPWDSPGNAKLADEIPMVYLPLNGVNKASTHLQAFVGPGTLFEGRSGIRWDDVPDGRDKTILLVEAANPVPWTKPSDLPYVPGEHLPKLGSIWRDGYHVLFADGQVRFLPYDTKVDVLHALITRNGKEALDLKQLPPPVEK